MANLQNRLSFTSRIITRGWIFVFFVAAVLSTSISFAEIVGTEDFDGNKSGWNWDGGTAQGWTNRDGNPIDITTETDDSGNHRAKIVSSQVFLSYGTSDNLNSGTFAYAFDMQLPSQKIWGGFSLFSNNNSSEKLFLGVNGENVLRLINYGSSTDFTSTTNDYLGTNNTFAVVANSTGIFAWAFPLGHKLQYEDLYTTPTLQLATTLGANSSFRLGTGETIYVDNIKMAYSDSNTVTSKDDATAVTSLTEVFDAVPIVECIKEAFSNYEDGPIAGQFQKNLGQAPLTKWTGSGPTIDNSQNLDYPGWSSEQGVLKVSNGNNAKMTLDPNVMASWGVMGTDGLIGGAGISDKILYYGFLMQQSEATGTWAGGAELYRGNNELLGLSYLDSENMRGFFYDSNNAAHVLNFDNNPLDSNVHLFVVKLMYGADGTGDDALIFIDPDMTLSEEEQDPLHVYKLSEMTGLSSQDLSFDSIIFRGGRPFTYDEFRMAKTWESLADVPEPSTWALMALGAAGLLYVRKRNK